MPGRDDTLRDQQREVVVVYFGLDVFCLLEARALKFEVQYCCPRVSEGEVPCPRHKTLASNIQIKSGPNTMTTSLC